MFELFKIFQPRLHLLLVLDEAAVVIGELKVEDCRVKHNFLLLQLARQVSQIIKCSFNKLNSIFIFTNCSLVRFFQCIL